MTRTTQFPTQKKAKNFWLESMKKDIPGTQQILRNVRISKNNVWWISTGSLSEDQHWKNTQSNNQIIPTGIIQTEQLWKKRRQRNLNFEQEVKLSRGRYETGHHVIPTYSTQLILSSELSMVVGPVEPSQKFSERHSLKILDQNSRTFSPFLQSSPESGYTRFPQTNHLRKCRLN